jgi:hypothetical protein
MRAWLAVTLLLVGCMDKAKADYDKCVERDRNYDVAGAVTACQAAVAADPKSPSGQAAAKKLLDLQTVNDKLKVEHDEKSAREASIKKEDPPLVIVHSAEPVASGAPQAVAASSDGSVLAQAQALMAQGDTAGARALLQERALSGKANGDEAKLLLKICKQQKDKVCLTALAKVGVR